MISAFFNLLYYKLNHNLNLLNNNLLYISKVGMWLPREGKNKNVFWFTKEIKKNKKYKFKKINCYDFVVLFNKISYNNSLLNYINNSDRKKYRITSSILNVLIETPQINMCKKYFQFIKFHKCGSKFIKNNRELFKFNKKKYKLWNRLDRYKCKLNLFCYLKQKKVNRIVYKQDYKYYNLQNEIFYIHNKKNIKKMKNINYYEIIKNIINSNLYNKIYSIVIKYYLFEK